MALRLGELMVQRGLLTRDQVESALDFQKRHGGAFGDIAERLFKLHPADVESAWAAQYASLAGRVDLSSEEMSDEAAEVLTARQAWQFKLLPIRVEDGEVVFATTETNLARALRFVYRAVSRPSYFVVVEAEALEKALGSRYPSPGLEGVDDFPRNFAAALAAASQP